MRGLLRRGLIVKVNLLLLFRSYLQKGLNSLLGVCFHA